MWDNHGGIFCYPNSFYLKNKKEREKDKQMKKTLAIMLALIMVLAMVPALADDPPTSGNCGASGNENKVTWKLEQNNADTANPTYTLTISGSGAMADYKDTGWRSQPWGTYAEKITKFVVEEGVTVIGISATDGENMIVEYDIAKSVKEIKDFGISTYAATTFNLNGNTNFKVVDGVLFSADGKTLYAYPGGRAEIEVYNVPSDVTRINGGAFNGAKMKKLIFGNNSIDIASWTFQDCTAEYMELNGTNLSGSESFRHFSKLKYLKIAGGSIPSQFFCGVGWTFGPNTAAIEKISISKLPTGNRPFFLQYKLTTVDLSQCGNVGSASEGLFCDTGYTVKDSNYKPIGKRISKITFYFNTADDAESFKNNKGAYYNKTTDTDEYESNDIFAVLNGGSIPSTEGWYNGKKYTDGDGLEIEEGQFVLATPVRPGYNFDGWYTNADFSGDLVTTVEEAGGTYYAKWTEKPQEQQPTPTPYNGGGNGGGYWHPTTTPVPVIVIPPKTGDMTIWQSILHFFGIR